MSKIKELSIKALTFLRVIDAHDGLISITNVQSIIVLAKLQIAPSVGIVEIGGLLIALASHQGKKIINQKSKSDALNEIEAAVQPTLEKIDAQKDKIESLQSTLTALQMKLGLQIKK